MISVEIRTTDPRFTELGRDGRVIVTGTETGRLTITATGRETVTFRLADHLPTPRDYPRGQRDLVAPADWVLA